MVRGENAILTMPYGARPEGGLRRGDECEKPLKTAKDACYRPATGAKAAVLMRCAPAGIDERLGFVRVSFGNELFHPIYR
jgi:hypothetical protein